MSLKVLIGVNLVQAFDRDTRLSLVTVPCAKTLLMLIGISFGLASGPLKKDC